MYLLQSVRIWQCIKKDFLLRNVILFSLGPENLSVLIFEEKLMVNHKIVNIFFLAKAL